MWALFQEQVAAMHFELQSLVAWLDVGPVCVPLPSTTCSVPSPELAPEVDPSETCVIMSCLSYGPSSAALSATYSSLSLKVFRLLKLVILPVPFRQFLRLPLHPPGTHSRGLHWLIPTSCWIRVCSSHHGQGLNKGDFPLDDDAYRQHQSPQKDC